MYRIERMIFCVFFKILIRIPFHYIYTSCMGHPILENSFCGKSLKFLYVFLIYISGTLYTEMVPLYIYDFKIEYGIIVYILKGKAQ